MCVSYRGVVDDDGFHEACDEVEHEDVPYFRQLSTTEPSRDCLSSPARPDSHASDVPAVSWTFSAHSLSPTKTALSVSCLFYVTAMHAFSALTLLVGRQKEHPACTKLSDEVLAWLSVCSKVQMICTGSS